MAAREWRPIADRRTRLRARERARAIAGELVMLAAQAPRSRRGAPVDLARGDAGIALFLAYAADLSPPARSAAQALLEGAIDRADAIDRLDFGLLTGWAGVAWTLEHLTADCAGAEAGADPRSCQSPLDEALLARAAAPSVGFDLVSGVIGLGVYALEHAGCALERALIDRVCSALAARARRDADGAAFFTAAAELAPDARSRFPAGAFDLGLAHGLAGAIAFLACCRDAEAAGPDEEALLAGAVSWLLARAQPPGAGARFPALWRPGTDAAPSRLAWCYGDLTAAVALARAGSATGRADWMDAARAVAIDAARRPADAAGVSGAGLCHGAAGVAHLFARLAHALEEPELEPAAVFWLQAAVDAPADGDGFLDGAAGLGLALLAATSNAEPAWDRALLVS